MNKPKAILFDYGDTLVNSEYFDPLLGTREILKYADSLNGTSAEEIQDYIGELFKEINPYDYKNIRQLNGVELHRLVYGIHNITFSKSFEELDGIFLDKAEKVELMEGLIEFLDYLKGEGIRLAVLSNTGFIEESHRIQLRRFGIEEYFEFFIATSDYLIRKPNRRVFDLALAKFGLSNEDVWYVGNKFEFDVLGAYNTNMFPVWINVNEEKPFMDIDYLDVKSYIELLDIVKKKWA